MIIDWHTNLWLEEHLDAKTRAGMARSSLGRSTDGTPERHEREILPAAEKFVVIACRWLRSGFDVPNDWVAKYVARFPDRAVGFACVDPNEATAPDELKRTVKTLGMRGLKLSPTVSPGTIFGDRSR